MTLTSIIGGNLIGGRKWHRVSGRNDMLSKRQREQTGCKNVMSRSDTGKEKKKEKLVLRKWDCEGHMGHPAFHKDSNNIPLGGLELSVR